MKTTTENPTLRLDRTELRRAIQEEYTEVACNPEHTIHFTSGRPLADRLGYDPEILAVIPEEAIRPFAGVGNPFAIGHIVPGETVLDIGSGAGLDCLYAWQLTRGESSIFGLDMTASMLEKARQNAQNIGADIHFLAGYAEHIPMPDASVDVVISNGVINLCPDKEAVYQEIFRILRPGGRILIADVILDQPVPVENREMIHLWTNCVAGAVPLEEYLSVIRNVGFADTEITGSYDVFRDARIARSAAHFGAKGYNLRGFKPFSAGIERSEEAPDERPSWLRIMAGPGHRS